MVKETIELDRCDIAEHLDEILMQLVAERFKGEIISVNKTNEINLGILSFRKFLGCNDPEYIKYGKPMRRYYYPFDVITSNYQVTSFKLRRRNKKCV